MDSADRNDARNLESRVRELEDHRAIIEALYRYGRGLDYGPLEAFLDVFTNDGRWERVEGRLPPRSFQGRNGLTQMWTVHSHAPDYFHKHTVVNPIIEIDGDRARASSYLVFICDHPEGPYVRAFSRCTDDLEREQDGRWRIRRRKAELESWSSHDYPPPPWQGLPDVVE